MSDTPGLCQNAGQRLIDRRGGTEITRVEAEQSGPLRLDKDNLPLADADRVRFAEGSMAFGDCYAGIQLHRRRNPLRRFVKSLYLRRVLQHVDGPTIDFGCGAGQLLHRLPSGSIGLEVNPFLIKSLHAEGLDVRASRGSLEDFDLPGLEAGRYRSLTILHVLEHLADPAAALERLLRACQRLDVGCVVVVVPGAKGYASDATHRTFVDRRYVDRHLPASLHGFERERLCYFPGPWEALGHLFMFHEMMIVYRRRAAPADRAAP